MTAARRPRRGTRSLVMPPGRKIPRSPNPAPRRPPPPEDESEPDPVIQKAAGELAAGWARIRACTACERACPERALGTGNPRAPIMLVKEHPSVEDLETSNALATEAESLAKAFEALGIPVSWLYGATAVRCGAAPATSDQVRACAGHLLVEIEAISPRVIVAFGRRAKEAVEALDRKCGILMPADIASGKPVPIRSDLHFMATEPLPEGITQKDSKRRLWRDLQAIRALIGE